MEPIDDRSAGCELMLGAIPLLVFDENDLSLHVAVTGKATAVEAAAIRRAHCRSTSDTGSIRTSRKWKKNTSLACEQPTTQYNTFKYVFTII